MDLLVLGGTAPLSTEVALAAVRAGHSVTCLARGESGDVPPGVAFVQADRRDDGAYASVAGRAWDAVVDVSWQPGLVRSALAALGEQAAHWTYVSSCSVYADHDQPGADEAAHLLPALEGDVAEDEAYGEAKVACERACVDAVGDRLRVSRAGLLGGPGDRSDRVGYWPTRFAMPSAETGTASDHGTVLVPDALDSAVQVLDLRDLGAWIVDAAQRGVVGTFNDVGEQTPLGGVLDLCREIAGHDGPVLAADPDWLVDQGVRHWAGEESLPLWLPPQGYCGFGARSDAAAVEAGLQRRPLAQTLADTLSDERVRGLDRLRRAGLSPARERELIDAWQRRG